MNKYLTEFCNFMEEYLDEINPSHPLQDPAARLKISRDIRKERDMERFLSKGPDKKSSAAFETGLRLNFTASTAERSKESAKSMVLRTAAKRSFATAKKLKKNENLNEAPKINIGRSHPNWLGPPSGLEKSIAKETGKRPDVTISNEKQTQHHSGKVHLNPNELRNMAKETNTPLATSVETAVAHELGHAADVAKGRLQTAQRRAMYKSLFRADIRPLVKEKHKAELIANREGEALLAKHGRPPMDPKAKKNALGSHHVTGLHQMAVAPDAQPLINKFTHGLHIINYIDRLRKQGIDLIPPKSERGTK